MPGTIKLKAQPHSANKHGQDLQDDPGLSLHGHAVSFRESDAMGRDDVSPLRSLAVRLAIDALS